MVLWAVLAMVALAMPGAQAQTLNTGDFRIEWKVSNRFRLFNDEQFFRLHEQAWRQYLLHVKDLDIAADDQARLIANSSVLGSEHVLNDRFIAFSRQLRSKFDWRGWAAQQEGRLCWNGSTRAHDACGGVEAYITPAAHDIEITLHALKPNSLIAEMNCEWRVAGGQVQTAPCDQAVTASLPYPGGGDISVNVVGEQPISLHAQVRDLLIVGLGDSFASGEGNPDVPVAFSADARYRNLYPLRARNDAGGSAQWTDDLCHRSLYSYQMRAALQIAIENPQASVTFLGYSCSGASVDRGILGGQQYVEMSSGSGSDTNAATTARYLTGGAKDAQIYRLLRELCSEKPQQSGGYWTCPGQHFRRPVDYVLLSVGGNDIGFANVVSWAALRKGTSATLAKFFGATVSPDQFGRNMRDILPGAYARLAKALELAVPLYGGDKVFDASHVIMTGYPDILVNETGAVCQANAVEGEDEDSFPANQSMDYFSSWLATTNGRLQAVHDQLDLLHQRMKELAGDQGWTYAGRVYEDKVFAHHGFCAQNAKLAADPAEVLMLPCWGKADRPTQTCQSSWSGKAREWRPYNPATQNYPYALRQRWVRTFNDAYMAINQKVLTRDGHVDDRASAQIFAETTGAMHPNAEGQAAMADAMLLDLRRVVADELAGN
jgi:lysophospholipase L1-like esterase